MGHFGAVGPRKFGNFRYLVVISIFGLVCPAFAGAAPRPRADQSHPALSIPSKATGGGWGDANQSTRMSVTQLLAHPLSNHFIRVAEFFAAWRGEALLLLRSFWSCRSLDAVCLPFCPDTCKCTCMAMARSGCVLVHGEMAVLKGRQLWILFTLCDASASGWVDVPDFCAGLTSLCFFLSCAPSSHGEQPRCPSSICRFGTSRLGA